MFYLPALLAQPSKLAVPNLFGTRNWFGGRQLSHGLGPGVGGGDFGTIQAHYIYCALDFYYYYISPTSDHQIREAGDPC